MVATPFGQRQEQETAVGSGFVLDGRGDIVTAAHVVDGASSIRVAFQNGAAREATILGTDDASDVALVHVDPAGLTLDPLTLGSSRALAVGDALAVIGDPLGFERTLSTGVVSGLDRTIQAPNGFEIAHAIQTDAAMNPGASGGPLFASDGRVIGIADQIATGTNQFGRSTTETRAGAHDRVRPEGRTAVGLDLRLRCHRRAQTTPEGGGGQIATRRRTPRTRPSVASRLPLSRSYPPPRASDLCCVSSMWTLRSAPRITSR